MTGYRNLFRSVGLMLPRITLTSPLPGEQSILWVREVEPLAYAPKWMHCQVLDMLVGITL